MVKTRLYNLPEGSPEREAAKYALYTTLITVIKLLAPVMPFITEEIYHLLANPAENQESIHRCPWPQNNTLFQDEKAEEAGFALVTIATAVRRYKSEKRVPMGSALAGLVISAPVALLDDLHASLIDIASLTRAQKIDLLSHQGDIKVAIL
jgi:valyl-tRNA synthetase